MWNARTRVHRNHGQAFHNHVAVLMKYDGPVGFESLHATHCAKKEHGVFTCFYSSPAQLDSARLHSYTVQRNAASKKTQYA